MNLTQQFAQVMKRISAGEASFSAVLSRYGFSNVLSGNGGSFIEGMLKSLLPTATGLARRGDHHADRFDLSRRPAGAAPRRRG